MKKKVIAYLHSHWDREWYREFEVFRLRLLRVFDNVLDLLENNLIPSFYFDGQVVALLDYLELRPEKENLIRELVKQKKLFIGPFYCLIDEFLTSETCFRKNLQIGLKIAKDFGCEDFIGYFADTFGHSKNIPPILKEYFIDKAIVWRGVGNNIPSEFIFNGVNTVNLVRGYFMDIFSIHKSIDEKAELLKKNLDLIAEKSSNYLLLPIGADHLGIESDIQEQINQINKILTDYEITLGSPFDYFKKVEFKHEHNEELRDNSRTFILQGAYSARNKLKQKNASAMYILQQADNIQKKYGNKYNSAIEYAYKLLLQNQAHDSICGCSTDLVHQENILRYEKIIQVANTIIEELRFEHRFQTPIIDSEKLPENYEIIDKSRGVENTLLYDTQRIPVTEDFKTIYKLRQKPSWKTDLELKLINGKLYAGDVEITFTRKKDLGDTYNFGATKKNKLKQAIITEVTDDTIKTDFFDIKFYKTEYLINFKITWNNKIKNALWQVNFTLPNAVKETYSEDLNKLIKRHFNSEYNLYSNILKARGMEIKTNFAPMQRFVWAQGFGIITKGLNEYEVYKNTLSITILRSIGIISNPKNPSRTTPAGPPIKVPEAQQLGINTAEFSVGKFNIDEWEKAMEDVYPNFI